MSLVGRLEDLGLSDIFQILSVGRKTGSLIIKSTLGEALIVFKNGTVVRAESTNMPGSLGEDLLNAGIIKKTTYDMAMSVMSELPDKSIAEVIFEFGAIKKESLERAARKRMERVVYQALIWTDGDFQFELDDVNLKEKINLKDFGWELSKGISPEYLLMEGARVQDEKSSGMFSAMEEESIGSEDNSGKGGWDQDWDEMAATPVGRKDISSLMALTQELRFPNSPSEVTLLILRFASDMFQRGVLFMVDEDKASGLGQFGLEIDDADIKIRQTAINISESSFLSRVVRAGHTYKGSFEKDPVTEFFMKEIGGGWPQECILFPLIADNTVVALLYCDNMPINEEIKEIEGLEIFMSQAGLALEKAILQRKLKDLEKRSGS